MMLLTSFKTLILNYITARKGKLFVRNVVALCGKARKEIIKPYTIHNTLVYKRRSYIQDGCF